MFKLVVLLSVASLAAAAPGLGVVPVAYSGVVPAVSSLSQYSSSVVHAPYAAAYSAPAYGGVYPAYGTYGAYAAPAVVLDPVHGVPLDTPEVVAARAAHFHAKALSGVHHLKKRSAVAPLAYSSVVAPYSAYSAYSAPVVSPYSYAAYSPLVSAYSSLPYHGVAPKALGVHPW